MLYKNTGPTAKTFYGVTFEPGETKKVDGRIYHHRFIQVDSLLEEPPVDNEHFEPAGDEDKSGQAAQGSKRGKNKITPNAVDVVDAKLVNPPAEPVVETDANQTGDSSSSVESADKSSLEGKVTTNTEQEEDQ